MLLILFKRKLTGLKNSAARLTLAKTAKNSVFLFAGLALLLALYFSFLRLLKYLDGVELIGEMLTWKLTSIIFLMSFSMIIVSSVIISMTTLFYSFDLKFLLSAPLEPETVFADKAADTAFYSSWTLALALMPYILALIRIKFLHLSFFAAYVFLLPPFILIAAAFGIFFSLLLMYFFPSSKTRDITWLLGSFSIAFVYVAFRFSKPEKLLRPDSLQVVAQYINYLQSPTISWMPSWWLTKAAMAFSKGKYLLFSEYAFYLYAVCAVLYAFLYFLAGKIYLKGFSGAQNSPRFSGNPDLSAEQKLIKFFPASSETLLVFFKERAGFSRDVKYWSQIILVTALVFVYLFSIKNLPLDFQDMRSFVSFLNIGVVGFVVSAICLRFSFPSVSLEGNAFWLLKASPISMENVLRSKLFFYSLPSVSLAFILVSFSNYLLGADYFISALSIFSMIVASFVMSVMAVGFGALFPDFKLENIHQIESSYGGFIFMASAMGYVALIIGIFAWPVEMHFVSRFNPGYIFEWKWFYFSAVLFLFLSFFAAYLPWKFGLRNLENYEV